ncbi:MAG: tetratricopeptide repeat protein [Candidatus Brocadiaceae bacterium]|nr:tetratricopeptide repeat protein [Candidatus Brocadiaceae bacterium]
MRFISKQSTSFLLSAFTYHRCIYKDLSVSLSRNAYFPTCKFHDEKTVIPFISSPLFCAHPLLTKSVNAVNYRENLIVASYTKAYADGGYIQDAIAAYKKSIEINPFNEMAHFNLGVIYGRLGLTEGALIEYENVLRLNKNNPHAHNSLGNIYEDKGFLDRAMAEYEYSLEIDPDSAITHNNTGNIYLNRAN